MTAEDSRSNNGPRKPRPWPSGSLLGSISETARKQLLAGRAAQRYPAGTKLITQGDDSTFVIVLLSGLVKVTGSSSSGREVFIDIRGGGDLLGELAAIDGETRSSTVTACTLVRGCVIPRPDFRAALARDQSLNEAVNQSVVAKLRAETERRMEFTAFDAPTRVARAIRELGRRYGTRAGNRVTIDLPVTQIELGSLASVAGPTAERVLGQLRQDGVVSTGYRRLIIEDLDRLNEIAGP